MKKNSNITSIDHALMEAADIMHSIQEHKGSIEQNLTPEIFVQLEMLEVAATALEELFQKSISIEKNDPSNMQEEVLNSPFLLKKHKKIIERAKAIRNDVQSMQESVAEAIKVKQTQENQQTQLKRKSRTASSKNSLDDKKKSKERRKLFKPLGNDHNWIPM